MMFPIKVPFSMTMVPSLLMGPASVLESDDESNVPSPVITRVPWLMMGLPDRLPSAIMLFPFISRTMFLFAGISTLSVSVRF